MRLDSGDETTRRQAPLQNHCIRSTADHTTFFAPFGAELVLPVLLAPCSPVGLFAQKTRGWTRPVLWDTFPARQTEGDMAELHLCSPRGFRASGVYAGIKTKQVPDVG